MVEVTGPQVAGRSGDGTRVDAMKGYAANAQVMADVAAVIDQARREGRDLATALRIARVTLAYVSGPNPDPDQAKAIEEIDRHLKTMPSR